MLLAQELYLNFPWNGFGFVLLSGTVWEHMSIVSCLTVVREVTMNEVYNGSYRRVVRPCLPCVR